MAVPTRRSVSVLIPATSRVLSRTAAHLEGAYRLACASVGSDLMSPWASTAMSIHLASAAVSVHLRACVPAADHRDCRSALRGAQACLAALPADHGVPLLDIALIHSRILSAVTATNDQPHSPYAHL